MKSNVSTNIRLPREVYLALKIRARGDGRSIAAHIRAAIRLYLNRKGPPAAGEPASDPLLSLVGIMDSGVRDGAEEHDHYLYGAPKRRQRGRRC